MSGTVYTELGTDMLGLRLQNKLTQKQLADAVGTTRQTIARIEKGNGANVAFGTWARIAEKLGHHFEIERDTIILNQVDPTYASLDYDPLDGYENWLED